MNWNNLNVLLAMAPPTQPGQQSTAPAWTGLIFPVLLIVVFYVILIRPQQKRAKEHETMMKSIKAGDEVVAGGGILGTVITVKEKTVTIRTADSKLEVVKSAVTEILTRTGDAPPK